MLDFLIKPPKIFNILTYNKEYDYILNDAYKLYQQIKERKLYKLIYSQTSNELIKYDEKYNDKDKYEIYQTKIGYVSGNKENPLDNIYFYNTKDIQKSYKINKNDISKLIPNTHQEYILMIYEIK